MKMPWSDLEGPAKALTISVAILLVAAGLCGVQFLIFSGVRSQGQFLAPLFMTMGYLELGVMLIAAVVAAASLLVWIATVIYNRFTGLDTERDETQKLFDDSDKQDGPQ